MRVVVTWRGTLRYAETLEEQRRYRNGVIRGTEPEALWLLEHHPVITTGRRDVSVDEARIEAAGYALVRTERGGLATCHEPGQLVGYLFVNARELGVRRLVAAIERGLASYLAELGLEARPRTGYPGVWVGHEKLAAIGLHIDRGVTMHGFALNLVNDLRGFGLITPCGIVDGGVSSVARLRGSAPTPEGAAPSVGAMILGAFRLEAVTRAQRSQPLDTPCTRE